MTRSALRAVAVKEFRALLPVSMAGGAAVAASTLASDDRIVVTLFTFAYVATSIALGALAMGHEYAHRTLPFLLAMPIHRGRIFAAKFAVVALMLGTVTALMWAMRPWLTDSSSHMQMPAAWLLVAPCCALLLTPTLTMLSRSTLGGMVFTLAIPSLLLVAADLVASARYGAMQPALADALKLKLFVAAVAAFCAAGAITAPVLFLRLQAAEGPGDVFIGKHARTSSVPAAVPAPRRRSALWLLVLKELRLQTMTFTVAGLYLAVWLGLLATGHTERGIVPFITSLYCGLLAVLVGALSSAEERQQGTLEWQLLLPMAAWLQWAVKAGVTLVLAVMLAVVLPYLLTRDPQLSSRPWVVAVVGIASASIYLSSLVTGGVRAMVTSILALVVARAAWNWMWTTGTRILSWMWGVEPLPPMAANFPEWLWWYRTVSSSVAGALVLTLLVFAYANHRSLSPSWPRVARQGAVVFGLMVLGALALSSLRFVRFAA